MDALHALMSLKGLGGVPSAAILPHRSIESHCSRRRFFFLRRFSFGLDMSVLNYIILPPPLEGLREHNCEECGLSFTRHNYLRHHVATVHRGKEGWLA